MTTLDKVFYHFTRNWPFVRGRHWLFRRASGAGIVKRLSESIQSGVKTRAGFRIATIEHDRVSDWIKVFGNYEVGTDRFLVGCARSGGLFLDIGSNIGYYSLLVASQHVSRNVWAFDPNPLVRECLENSIRLNSYHERVRVFPYALSDHDGHSAMIIEEGVSGSGHLSESNDGNEGGLAEIEIREFDPIWQAAGSPEVSSVKIDVEGHELQVLKAMKSVLEQNHPDIVIELVEDQLNRYGSSVEGVVGFLEGIGYMKIGDFELNSFFRYDQG